MGLKKVTSKAGRKQTTRKKKTKRALEPDPDFEGSDTQHEIIRLRQRGLGYFDISDELGVSKGYIYETLRKAGMVERRK